MSPNDGRSGWQKPTPDREPNDLAVACRAPCLHARAPDRHALEQGSKVPASIAVGTLITERPPHRSERAQFGHSAPTLGVWRRNVPSARGGGGAGGEASHRAPSPS